MAQTQTSPQFGKCHTNGTTTKMTVMFQADSSYYESQKTLQSVLSEVTKWLGIMGITFPSAAHLGLAFFKATETQHCNKTCNKLPEPHCKMTFLLALCSCQGRTTTQMCEYPEGKSRTTYKLGSGLKNQDGWARCNLLWFHSFLNGLVPATAARNPWPLVLIL